MKTRIPNLLKSQQLNWKVLCWLMLYVMYWMSRWVNLNCFSFVSVDGECRWVESLMSLNHHLEQFQLQFPSTSACSASYQFTFSDSNHRGEVIESDDRWTNEATRELSIGENAKLYQSTSVSGGINHRKHLAEARGCGAINYSSRTKEDSNED